MSLPDRFVAKLVIGDCWEWTGARNAGGYGQFRLSRPTRRLMFAHRFAYEALVGLIPAGLQLDHLCRNRACCNPDHLEVVTRAENTRRGIRGAQLAHQTHCKRGHPLSGDNLYPHKHGKRVCRTCKLAANRAWRTARQ